MKALFVHDHKFNVDKNGNVYSHLMDGVLWKRYLEHADSLTVLSRRVIFEENEKSASGMRPAGCEGVSFELLGQSLGINGEKLSAPGYAEKYRTVRRAVSQCDAVIARLPSVLGYMACREAIKQRKKYAVEVVACAWDSNFYHGNPKNRVMALPSLLIMKHYVKKADAAIYVTDEYLQKIYPCRGFTGIASNVVLEMPDERVLQNRIAKIESTNKKVIFGLVGSLTVNFKGHETAIKALAAARDRIPDFELHFIGTGRPDRWQKLADEQGIGERVFFDGLKKHGREVTDWMDHLDVLLIPSLQEGLPRALIEAMSCGLPALGAVTGGIPQLLPGGFLHKKKDWRKLSEDIVRLCGDKELMKKCAAENFEKVKRFDGTILEKSRFEFWKTFFDMCRQHDF
ncbi:MAG: glycosyltransferase family 4 protein [Clostridia bacterium]|nr:glycosyltransferase family 4 protein [Clostridia bacterium]